MGSLTETAAAKICHLAESLFRVNPHPIFGGVFMRLNLLRIDVSNPLIIMLMASTLVGLCAASAGAQDYSGRWDVVVLGSSSSCENIYKAFPGHYTIRFEQQGNQLRVESGYPNRIFIGTFERPGVLELSGNYLDEGGSFSEIVKIEFDTPARGGGKSSWEWSDGALHCSGKFNFTMKKQ